MSIFDKAWDSITKAWNGIFENFDNILSCIIQIALIIIAAKIIKAIVLNIIKRALEKKAKKNPDTLANTIRLARFYRIYVNTQLCFLKSLRYFPY